MSLGTQTRLKQIGVAMLALLMVGALTTASAQNATIAVQSFQDRIQFHAQTSDVEKLQLDVFDLSGSTVYDSDWASGRSLSWGLSTEDGQSVANGVYLYALRTQDAQGNVERYVGKLAVLDGKLQSADRSPQRSPEAGSPSSRSGGPVSGAQAEAVFTGIRSTQQSGTFPAALFQTDDATGGVSFEWGLHPDNFNNTWAMAAQSINSSSNAGDFKIQRKVSSTWQDADLRVDWDNGNVAIGSGTQNPSAKLVVGSDSGTNLIVAKDTSGSSAQTVFRVERSSGDVFADGSFNGGGADVAERIDVTTSVEAGDVVEIDPNASGKFRKAQSAMSRRVAGVISTDPGVVLGNRSVTAQGNQRDTRPLLALAGRVPVKATAKYGAIEAGDTLVSAPIPGYAQVCASDCTGAVLGKALEPLNEGTGKITVQVSLR
ncbi:MAG: hypothetical protein ABEL51_08125 [Salinibacter sp.]